MARKETIMATEKVGIYRKYRGSVPTDASGQPLPKREWIDNRAFSWAVRWFGVDGKRYSKSFNTRKEAERFAETKQQGVRQGKADPPKRVSLREFYVEHKRLMKDAVSEGTLHMQLAEKFGWERDLRKCLGRDIEDYRAWRMETGKIGKVSANKEVRCLRRLFNLAILRGYICEGCNPCRNVSMLKVADKRPAYCSSEQFQSIVAQAVEVMWQALTTIVYSTGIRLREATNLTWSDIDFNSGELHIAAKDAQGYVQAWTPKDHERRTLRCRTRPSTCSRYGSRWRR